MAKNHRPVFVPRTTAEWLDADTPKLARNEIGLNTDNGEERHGPGAWGALTPVTGKEAATVIVRAATTGNVTISTALNAGDTLDDVVLAAGDLVLVHAQSSPAQNGFIQVGASPARAAAFDTWDEHVNKLVYVEEGTTNGGKYFLCSVNSGGTLDSTSMTFVAADARGALKLATRGQVARLTAGTSTEAGTSLVLIERADGVLRKLSLADLKDALAALA